VWHCGPRRRAALRAPRTRAHRCRPTRHGPCRAPRSRRPQSQCLHSLRSRHGALKMQKCVQLCAQEQLSDGTGGSAKERWREKRWRKRTNSLTTARVGGTAVHTYAIIFV
jgi:hypothetical protein